MIYIQQLNIFFPGSVLRERGNYYLQVVSGTYQEIGKWKVGGFSIRKTVDYDHFSETYKLKNDFIFLFNLSIYIMQLFF